MPKADYSNNQRHVFAECLEKEMKDNDKIKLIVCDLGFGLFDRIRDLYPAQFLNVGAAEQTGLDIACGFAYQGYTPVVYTITPFFYRGYETLRTYINHESLAVKLIGAGRDTDYVHNGFSHNAEDANMVFGTLDNIWQFYPGVVTEIPALVHSMLYSKACAKRPVFISLKR